MLFSGNDAENAKTVQKLFPKPIAPASGLEKKRGLKNQILVFLVLLWSGESPPIPPACWKNQSSCVLNCHGFIHWDCQHRLVYPTADPRTVTASETADQLGCGGKANHGFP
jgi:hypothetical protein